jgi:small subunit ribosomal protein S4e
MNMGNKGGTGHLKRLPAPGFWPIHRKEFVWAPKPSPGAHKTSSCLPLELVLRDELGQAKTRREVAAILASGKVRVDGRVRQDKNFPVGIMDVVELIDANIAYRILPVEGRGLSPVRIPKDEAKFKLCKILRKNTEAKGLVQFGMHDGRNFTVSPSDAEASGYSTNDTLRLSVPTQRVLGHIKFEKGNSALVVAGRNLGRTGRIVELQGGTATRPAMVTIEGSSGSKIDTIVDYTFVVGTDKPTIKLEAS